MLELLFPSLCSACGIRTGQKTPLCHDCLGKLRYLVPPWCLRCGCPQSLEALCVSCTQDPPPLEKIRSVFVYEEPLRSLIHRWKYQDQPQLAHFFARQLILFTELYLTEKTWDLIVPIPLYPTRERERDYNQSGLLAKSLSQAFGISLCQKILKRIRATAPQSSLSEPQRKKNLNSAFWVSTGLAFGKRVLLVDDLYTTGTTVKQAALCLKKAGALQVEGLTLARTLLF